MTEPRLLIGRFEPHASGLSKLLNSQGIFAVTQPLLKTEKSAEFTGADAVFTKSYDIIIAVSRNAVDYSNQALAQNSWPQALYLAVGRATRERLQKVTGCEVIIPERSFDSEGVLALPCLQAVKGKKILILRGVGGRELLADSLTESGASVDYYQPYQRIAVDFERELVLEKWQQQKINGAIISSVELLDQLITLFACIDDGWLKKLTIYAPSQRILEQAVRYGFFNVQLLPGLQGEEIVQFLKFDLHRGGYDRR